MKFLVITHVLHTRHEPSFYAYGPYVKEMNLWFKYVDEIVVVAPLANNKVSKIDLPYSHKSISLLPIKAFSLTSFSRVLYALLNIPAVVLTIYKAMKSADHIHLRCPGNVGLLACFVQILFPGKIKTAKYAGNWDPDSKQPLSYRFQKWILNSTFLTRNMTVLVYGDWPNSSRNLKPFFTATYHDSDKVPVIKRNLSQRIEFLFVGALSKGKRPQYAVQLVERLVNDGFEARLRIFGEGPERQALESYIQEKRLEHYVELKGNQTAETVKEAYKNSHFLVLLSKSEGWPKVVAEAMFWGCVPISTPVSCVGTMLDGGHRGLLLSGDIGKDTQTVEKLLQDAAGYETISASAMLWSRKYTLEYFESEIKKLLHLPNL